MPIVEKITKERSYSKRATFELHKKLALMQPLGIIDTYGLHMSRLGIIREIKT